MGRRDRNQSSLAVVGVFSLVLFAMTTGGGCQAQESKEKLTPRSLEGWHERVEKALLADKAEEALREIDDAIIGFPANAQLLAIRGSLKFRSGKIADSIVDFDKSIELSPESKPYLWQRGIALYYAKRYQDGLDQFAVHREVNPNDVENAFWHFLCNVRIKGLEASQKDVLLAGFDSRVPLMEVQKLIQGKLTPEDLIAVCDKSKAGSSGRFYGYLYLGLYYDALQDHENSKRWLEKCVEQKVDGYMGDVAKIHLKLMNKDR